MGNRGLAWGMALLVAAAPAVARAAGDTGVVLAEVTAALTAGDGAAAVRLTTSALAAGGISRAEQAQFLVDRGLGRAQQGQRDAALVDYTTAIEMHALAPMLQAHALFDRGVTLDEMDRTADALADYDAAIRLSPKFASPLNNRANIHRRQGRPAEARRDYMAALQAVNLHPEFSYFGLGQLAEQAGDKATARDFYARAAAANPAYGEAQARLAALDGADDAPITLRPPPGAAPVVLRPPQAIHLHPPAPKPVPARLVRPVAEPLLRPALDRPAPADGPQIQLGAWRSEAEANQGWDRARRLAPGLLGGLSPHIVPVDLAGRGRYYRLRVPGSARLCASLEGRGVECMAARD